MSGTFVRIIMLLLLVCSSWHLCQAGQTLEDLLATLNVPHTRDTEGKIIISIPQDDGSETRIVAQEVKINEGDLAASLVYLYSRLLPPPSDGEYKPPQLRKIAELNEKMKVGKVGLAPDGAIYYCSSFWLEGATAKTLMAELAIGQVTIGRLRKVLDF